MGVGLEPHEQQVLLGAVDHKEATGAAPFSGERGCGHVFGVLPGQLERQRITALAHQTQHQGDHDRILLRLPWGRWGALTNAQPQGAGITIPVTLDLQLGRARLAVPAAELLKIKPGQRRARSPGLLSGIFHRLNEVLAGGGGAVMTAHIESHTPHERLLTQQGVQHTDDFRSLLVNRRCVEVVDRLVVIRLNRVGRRSRILPELGVAQQGHIVDALHLR